MRERRRSARDLGADLLLAVPPTVVVLVTALLIEAVRHERLLFASLASSAFLIYRDPTHPMNGVRIMIAAHSVAVTYGATARLLLGPGYVAAALAMTGTILTLVVANIVHPPAIATALGFAFVTPETGGSGLFLLALVMLAVLVLVQRAALWAARRVHRRTSDQAAPGGST